jgi:DNA-binding NarL/FixJ family response regulator
MMSAVNVLIADDHPIFLKGLREVIEEERDMKVIYFAANGEDALAGITSKLPDVVILDVDMPKMNGLQVAEKALAWKPELAIILLTMHKAKDAFVKALEIGVLGYVLKENTVMDIVNAIHAVKQGNAYISPEMSTFLLTQKNKSVHGADHLTEILTHSELRILNMVALYKSTKEIAEELHISEKTVSNHRMNITRKLNLTGKNSLLRFATEKLPNNRL